MRYYRLPGTWTTDLFAVLSPSLGLSCHPPRIIVHHRTRTRVRTFVPCPRHFSTSYVGSLCAGSFDRNGNVETANKTISARSTLNIETPEIAARAHSGVIYRKRSIASTGSGRDTWDTSANTAIYDDTMLYVSRDVHWNLRIPFRAVKWKRITSVIASIIFQLLICIQDLGKRTITMNVLV